MKYLSKLDQDVLRAMREGLADHEVCRRMQISPAVFAKSLARIRARADQESEDAGRFYEQALRKRAERMLASMAARFHALMETSPHAVLVVNGRTGAIKEFNELACELFGYSKQEFGALTVEHLVPESIKAIHHAYRLGFLASVRKREMGYHPPIIGIRKDRSEVEMAIALTATVADDDIMVVCTERANWIGGEAVQATAGAEMA